MSQGFPDQIQIGGGAGGDPSGRGMPHGPDRGDHSDNLNDAIVAIDAYIGDETDEADIAEARKIQALIAKLRQGQQDLVDKATGAGPGVRLMRKSGGGGAPQGGGGDSGY